MIKLTDTKRDNAMPMRNLIQSHEVPIIQITIPAYPGRETCPFLYRNPRTIMTWFRVDELRERRNPATNRQDWIISRLVEIYEALGSRQIPWVFQDENGLRRFDRGAAKYLYNNNLIEYVTNRDGYITHVQLTDKFVRENPLPH